MKILTAPQSGSQAGTTASRNRFGQYLRTRGIPVQPRTPKQTHQRALFSAGSSGWRTLSDAERDAWNTYASQIQRSDSLGQNYTPTGAELATAAVTLGASPGSLAPTVLPVYTFIVAAMSYTGPSPGPEAFTITPAYTDANNQVIIETSGNVSPGITSAAAVRRWVSLPDTAANLAPKQFAFSASPIAILTYYKFVFPSPVTGDNIWFRFSEVSYPGGGTVGIRSHQKSTFRFIVP